MAFARASRAISGFRLRIFQKPPQGPNWLGFGRGTKTKKPWLFGLRPEPEKHKAWWNGSPTERLMKAKIASFYQGTLIDNAESVIQDLGYRFPILLPRYVCLV
jgi:hypothetical protein